MARRDDRIDIRPLGDLAVLVTLGDEISPALARRVRALSVMLEAEPIDGVIEHIPAYASVAVTYEPWRIGFAELSAALRERIARSGAAALPPARLVEIPVCYGGELGPDIEDVARFHSATPQEVAAEHAAPAYLVYMLGFMPGFPYLGGLPEKLATPRLATPRQRVPAGSVGIAGSQTGVYPLETPGGWRIIGRTPLRLYDPAREPAALLQAGDTVRFTPIDRDTFGEIATKVALGTYSPAIRPIDEGPQQPDTPKASATPA